MPVRASLFVTCIVDQLYPEVGESVVRVLRRLGVDVDFPPAQTCCGQPAFNSGFWSDAKPIAERLLSTFRSEPCVVVPSGSCASMIRVFYSELFPLRRGGAAVRPSRRRWDARVHRPREIYGRLAPKVQVQNCNLDRFTR